MVHVEVGDPLLERVAPGAALLRIHLEGELQRGGQPFFIVGIHEDGFGHEVRRARHLREDKRSPLVGRHELVRDEVHPIAQRSHEGGVGGAVECTQLLLRKPAVVVVDGDPLPFRERPVDPAHEFVHLAFERLVRLDAGAAGRSDLVEADVPPVVGVALQEPLESVEASEDALRVVQPVHAEQNGVYAGLLAERLGALPDLRRG